MTTYRLKRELTFDQLMPAVLLAQTLFGHSDPNIAARCTVQLLEAILEDSADVIRFVQEAEQVGPKAINRRVLEFYS